jgi:hypothetical protein
LGQSGPSLVDALFDALDDLDRVLAALLADVEQDGGALPFV